MICKKHIGYLSFVALLWLNSCGDPKVFSDSDSLTQYVSSSEKYHQETQAGATILSVTYRPTDLVLSGETRENTPANEITEKREHYNSYLYFQLAIQQDGKEWLQQQISLPTYGDLVQTLSFRMGQYVQLITPSDTLAPVSTYHDRMYGLSKATQLLIAFPRTLEKEEQIKLVVREFGGGLGMHQFAFQSTDLLNEPELKLNTYE